MLHLSPWVMSRLCAAHAHYMVEEMGTELPEAVDRDGPCKDSVFALKIRASPWIGPADRRFEPVLSRVPVDCVAASALSML